MSENRTAHLHRTSYRIQTSWLPTCCLHKVHIQCVSSTPTVQNRGAVGEWREIGTRDHSCSRCEASGCDSDKLKMGSTSIWPRPWSYRRASLTTALKDGLVSHAPQKPRCCAQHLHISGSHCHFMIQLLHSTSGVYTTNVLQQAVPGNKHYCIEYSLHSFEDWLWHDLQTSSLLMW